MRTALLALDVTPAQMARRMSEYREGRNAGRRYGVSTMRHYTHPRARWACKMSDDAINACRRVILDELQNDTGSARVRFDLAHHSPWKCTLMLQCDCGAWYAPDFRRRDWARCGECSK